MIGTRHSVSNEYNYKAIMTHQQLLLVEVLTGSPKAPTDQLEAPTDNDPLEAPTASVEAPIDPLKAATDPLEAPIEWRVMILTGVPIRF